MKAINGWDMGKMSFEEIPNYMALILDKLTVLERMIAELKPSEVKSPKLLNIQQASELIHLKVSTIYTKISKKTIPYIKTDKAVLFEEEALLEWRKQRSKREEPQSLYYKAEEFVQKRKVGRRW